MNVIGISKPNGKIHRVYPDGRIANTNPFYRQKNVVKSIYSFGHGNPQGLAVHPETGLTRIRIHITISKAKALTYVFEEVVYE